jgi:hypothetical protein
VRSEYVFVSSSAWAALKYYFVPLLLAATMSVYLVSISQTERDEKKRRTVDFEAYKVRTDIKISQLQKTVRLCNLNATKELFDMFVIVFNLIILRRSLQVDEQQKSFESFLRSESEGTRKEISKRKRGSRNRAISHSSIYYYATLSTFSARRNCKESESASRAS